MLCNVDSRERRRNLDQMRITCCSALPRFFALCLLLYAGKTCPAQYSKEQTADLRRKAVEANLFRYIQVRGTNSRGLPLKSEMKRLRVPAVSIAALKDGRIDWARAYGYSQPGKRATTATLFEAASISKAVTAIGVLKLVQDGRLTLDENVNRYLKKCQIPDNQFTTDHKVTVRELLSHTSGIGSHNGEIYNPAEAPTLLQIFDGKPPARTAPVRVEAVPGSKFAYSNGGYLILSLLIEDIT